MEVVGPMATRNVVLTEHQDKLIAALVKAGKFQNASEVLRAGLRLLERQQSEDEARLLAFHVAAEKGWDDVDSGRYSDLTDATLADHVVGIGVRATRARDAG
jgi:antitoxin ParD1/3/4